MTESQKRWREKNKEKLREYNRQWREKNKESCKAKAREYEREYRDKNRDQLKEYKRSWNEENKERVREPNRIRYKQRRDEWRLWFDEYRATLSCQKCGENHPATIDFHHRDPNEKDSSVATLVQRAAAKEVILAEIAKCDVLCCKCHRILHWEERQKK